MQIPNNIFGIVGLIDTETLCHQVVNSVVDNFICRFDSIVKFTQCKIYLCQQVVSRSLSHHADINVVLEIGSRTIQVILQIAQNGFAPRWVKVITGTGDFFRDERDIAILMHQPVVTIRTVEASQSFHFPALVFIGKLGCLRTGQQSVGIFNTFIQISPVVINLTAVSC